MKLVKNLSFIKTGLLSISFLLTLLFNTANAATITVEQAQQKLANIGLSGAKLLLTDSGYYLFRTDHGIIYLSTDGLYLIQGRVSKLDNHGTVSDLTTKFVLDQIEANQNNIITYKSLNEKYVVNVFSDYTCHYCKILHSNIAEYNKLGITIREMPFPRAGINSDVARNLAYIYAQPHDKRAELISQAFNRNFSNITESPNTKFVADIYALGELIGLRGTPTMIISGGVKNGLIIPGFLQPSQLLQELQK